MDAEGAGHKKHKKHKKHKHKRKHQPDDDSDGEINVTDDVDLPKPSIKLKIKFGGQTVETKNSWGSGTGSTVDWNDQFLFGADEAITNIPVEESDSLSLWSTDEVKLDPAADDSPDKTDNKKEANVDTSDEEREWLDALEAGKLDDNGDVIKKKDPSLLTARQRALLHGDQNDELLQLPSGYKAPELTEEQLQRRLQRAKKRREQAHQKQEKDKKQTIDRLLQKQQGTKSKKGKSARKARAPAYSYHNDRRGITISVPQGFSFPAPAQKAPPPPVRVICGIAGCSNVKKYSCSKTGVPLCSLACYQKNLASRGIA